MKHEGEQRGHQPEPVTTWAVMVTCASDGCWSYWITAFSEQGARTIADRINDSNARGKVDFEVAVPTRLRWTWRGRRQRTLKYIHANIERKRA